MTQDRVVATGGIAGIGGLLFIAWALLFSRLRRWSRLAVLGSILGLAAFALLSLEVRGVTGDLVPVISWRFGAREEALPSPSAYSGAESARSAQTWLDFPQFLGLWRDGTVPGVSLARDWTQRPPRALWRRQLGAGWSGFAVSGANAVTQEQRGEYEAVVCYDLLIGDVRWVHAHAARYETKIAGIGPRATAAIADGRVFALGATGILDCIDERSGELVWERDVLADNGAVNNPWGTSCSPLLHDGLVVVTPGGSNGRSMVAYDARNGERRWSGGTDRAGYSSPCLAELAGAPQLLALNAASLAAQDPASGALFWSVAWSDRNPNVAQPLVVAPDAVIVSSGYGVGAARFRVARDAVGGFEVQEEWSSRALKSKFANFVHRAGFLYGFDDGILACVDAATGRRSWKAGRYGHGQLLLVDDLLLVVSEPGDIVLVEATPEEHRELARAQALDDKTWNPPALAAPYLLVRNDLEAVCLELPLAASVPAPTQSASR